MPGFHGAAIRASLLFAGVCALAARVCKARPPSLAGALPVRTIGGVDGWSPKPGAGRALAGHSRRVSGKSAQDIIDTPGMVPQPGRSDSPCRRAGRVGDPAAWRNNSAIS